MLIAAIDSELELQILNKLRPVTSFRWPGAKKLK